VTMCSAVGVAWPVPVPVAVPATAKRGAARALRRVAWSSRRVTMCWAECGTDGNGNGETRSTLLRSLRVTAGLPRVAWSERRVGAEHPPYG